MRFIITAQAKDGAPAPDLDTPFDEALFSAYMRFNEEMYRAGVLVASEGLNPSGKGARVEVTKKGRRSVVDGPFAESKELVGGFYIIEVDSLDEAIEWALKCPSGMGSDDILDIRPLTSESDIPPHLRALLASAVGNLLESMLYGVSALDAIAFAAAAVVMLLVAALANLIPAAGATRVDPVRALRSE